jgi:hypothetical protein
MCKMFILDVIHSLNYKFTTFRKLDSASVFRKWKSEGSSTRGPNIYVLCPPAPFLPEYVRGIQPPKRRNFIIFTRLFTASKRTIPRMVPIVSLHIYNQLVCYTNRSLDYHCVRHYLIHGLRHLVSLFYSGFLVTDCRYTDRW